MPNHSGRENSCIAHEKRGCHQQDRVNPEFAETLKRRSCISDISRDFNISFCQRSANRKNEELEGCCVFLRFFGKMIGLLRPSPWSLSRSTMISLEVTRFGNRLTLFAASR